MKNFISLALLVVAGLFFTISAPRTTRAQVNVNIGIEPDCPYGYYDYAPYACAPYGYYGPEWFSGGVFIGVGPWFHGPAGFHGYVDNHFDVHHGYKGPMPKVGDKREPDKHPEARTDFKGNEMRDGRGHTVKR